jgi:hypothetical protein
LFHQIPASREDQEQNENLILPPDRGAEPITGYWPVSDLDGPILKCAVAEFPDQLLLFGTPVATGHWSLPIKGRYPMTLPVQKIDPKLPASDELILQQLGTAVLLCWTELPIKVQETILEQSKDMMGFAPVADTYRQIVGLLLRHER